MLVDGDNVMFDTLDKTECYTPVGLLENEVRHGTVVRLTARTAGSTQFLVHSQAFKKYWKNATDSL